MSIDVTTYDDHTLEKVRAGLREADPFLEEQLLTDMIAGMQNQGILFRERTTDASGASDGYHTFGELYDHRRALTAVLASAAAVAGDSWRSKAHHPDDDPIFEGYFIVGVVVRVVGTITYHYELTHWDDFAAVPELDHAPKWDGATPADSVTRMLDLARKMGDYRALIESGVSNYEARETVWPTAEEGGQK